MGAGLKRRRARTRESARRERCPPLNSVKDCFQTPWKATCPDPRSWAQHPSPLNPQATLPDQIDLAMGYDFDIWEIMRIWISKSIKVDPSKSTTKHHRNATVIHLSSSFFQQFFALISKPSVSSIPCGGSNFALVLGSKVPKMESKSFNMTYVTSAHKPHKRCQKLEVTQPSVKNSVLPFTKHKWDWFMSQTFFGLVTACRFYP